MEIHDYLRALRRGWLLLVLLTVLGALVGAGAAAVITPKYSAEAKAYVSTQATSSIGDLSQGAAYTQQVIVSYADIATTASVLNRVKAELGLKMSVSALAKMVTVVPATGETVLDVSVVDTSPDRAAAIADSVVKQLATTVDSLSLRAEGTKAPVAVRLVNGAVEPVAPDSPKPLLFTGLGALAGLLIAFFVAVLREVLDTRVTSIADANRVVDVAVLGVVADDRRRSALQPGQTLDARRDAEWTEPYRSLRNNLRYMELGAKKRSIVVTSSIAGEGKTTSVVNLGLALADAGERVVLVDADLRRPQLAERFGIDGSVGLSDVLIGAVELDEALQAWGDGKVMVLPSGQVPPNPNELVQTEQMRDLIALLGERFDVIVFDSPPLATVSDAAVLARSTTGVLLVAAARQVKRPQLEAARRTLEQARARVLGLVLTKVPKTGSSQAYYSSIPVDRAPRSKKDRSAMVREMPSVSQTS